MVTCVAALVDTGRMYIQWMESPPFNVVMRGGCWAVLAAGIATAAIVTVLIAWRTNGLRRRLKRNGCWSDETDLGFRYTALTWASVCAVILAVGGPVYVRFLGHPGTPSATTMWWAAVGDIFLPCLIFIFVAYSVPGPPMISLRSPSASLGTRNVQPQEDKRDQPREDEVNVTL